MKLILLVTGLLFVWGVHGQSKLDSVKRVAKTGKGLAQFHALNTLSDYYSDNDLPLSMQYARQSLVKARNLKNDSCVALAYNSIANVFQYQTRLDSALAFHQKALALRIQLKDSAGMADTHNNIGIAYDQQADFPKALQHYFMALAYFDRKQLAAKQAMTYTNIGIVYKAQKEFTKALDYYRKAYDAYQRTTDAFGQTVSAGNLGSILINFKRYDESLRYSEMARLGYQKIAGDRFTGYPIANMATVYDSLKQFDRANARYREAIALHEKHHNDFEVAETANTFAHSLIRQKKYNESIAVSNRALRFARATKAAINVVAAYKNLAHAHAALRQYPEAYRYSDLYNAGKDSIFRAEKTQAMAEMAAKYDTEKKERLINEQKAEARRKNFMLLVVSLLAVFVVLIVLLLFRQQRLKNAQLQQEHRLKTAIAQIETQNQLQEQRLGISRDLHDNIGAQLTFIISSVENIKYAFDIGNPKLDDKLQSISSFAQSTIVELRDTIWAMNSQDIVFEDLKARILNFIEKARTATEEVDFQFVIDPELVPQRMSSVVGMNLYRTIQEAVNNALKYGQCSRIVILAESVGEDIQVSIEDNGVGFDPETIARGNGLVNMEKRIADIGGSFQLQTQVGKGTKIVVTLACDRTLT
ncbi:tetratricopeptide repeat-containing sensor histidine kinase [Flavobacterium caeni]|uniref:histidine kinase n=1 Tax=Flavobacterium caeni TaxID=490189 RepID=A0A1G5J6J1_9FLAO|nr:sensor histidine kinase [Flavobacterium caeni]SCY83550.1 Tetratricopeptide repeat-containing protein [Flavobacterium caeni]